MHGFYIHILSRFLPSWRTPPSCLWSLWTHSCTLHTYPSLPHTQRSLPTSHLLSLPSPTHSPVSHTYQTLPLTPSVAGDMFLLNLRSDLSQTKSALLLHHRGYDCTFTSTPEFCQSSNGTVSRHEPVMCAVFLTFLHLYIGGVEWTLCRC